MRAIVCGLWLLAAVGCGSANRGASPNPATEKASEKPSAEVTVKVLSLDDFHALVASHKGKVVVVDCWSTS